MSLTQPALVFLAICGVAIPTPSAAQATTVAASRVEGHLVYTDGSGVGGALVLLEELGRSELTDDTGRYAFGVVLPGSYTLVATRGKQSLRQPNVIVGTGTTSVRTTVDWPVSVFESVLVTGATRSSARLVEAPASASVLGASDLAPHATHGQLPRVLAGAVGVELVQSGLYDFNLNSRGFNNYFNRHILTRIDGRDPSLPTFLGYVDWAALSLPLDDIDRVEFVRGPGAALYGAGAFNGVLNVTTKAPRDSVGGNLRYTVGEVGTQRVEARVASAIGRTWYVKATGGHHRSGDFTRSRVDVAEYAPDALPADAIAPIEDHVRLSYGSVRLDNHRTPDQQLSLEGGVAHVAGPVTVSPAGRTQGVDTLQPWFRASMGTPRWNVRASYTGNRMDGTRNLTAGSTIYVDASQFGIEGQANRQFAGARGRLIVGTEFGRQLADTADPQGSQTAFDRKRTATFGSVFGQVEYLVAGRLNAVMSARLDASTLHSRRLSPRFAAVYRLASSQAVRVTYGRAFQPANLTDYFLYLPVAPPLDLSALEAGLKPVVGDESLGFEHIALLAVGNDRLRVEQIDSVEAGYQGVVRGRLLLNASVYRNRLKDFVTFLLPQVGTSLGRLNPTFGPYAPPPGLSAQATATVLAALQTALPPPLFEALSNDAEGRPVIPLLSYGNFGAATAVGVELGATLQLPAGWSVHGAFTGFRSSVTAIPESPLSANTPTHQVSAGAAYARSRMTARLHYRWVSTFQWESGVYRGPVPSYGIADLNVSVRLADHVTAGADVANLFDHAHYEAFGGDLLGRRALTHLSYTW